PPPHPPPAAADRRDRSTVDLEHRPKHPEAGSFLQAGFVQRPTAVHDLAVHAYHHGKRHTRLGGVVALDDVLEHRIDVVGLGLGKKPDAAEIDAQHRYFDVAGQLGG